MDIAQMESESKTELLLVWHTRATRASLVHYAQAEKCLTVNTILTVFNLLAAISVLFLVSRATYGSGSLYLSLAGLAVVLSTAFQYVLKLEERCYDHKAGGNEFASIKRKIELYLTLKKIADSDLFEIDSDYTHTAKNHSIVRKKVWATVSKRLEHSTAENCDFFQALKEKRKAQNAHSAAASKSKDGSNVKIMID